MTNALAYFPNLSAPRCSLSSICPVSLLLRVAVEQGGVSKGFLKAVGKAQRIGKYVQKITESKQPVSPYALRIGGRTWYLSQDLDRQFVDYLGTWSSPEAAARYYRASPSAVLQKLQRFYHDVQT